MIPGYIASMIVISIASNLDNAGVGIAYGVKGIKIPYLSNVVIALMGFLFSLIGGIFGDWIAIWLPLVICKFIGMILMVAIGILVLSQSFLRKKKNQHPSNRSLLLRILQNPEEAEFDATKSVGFIESIILSIALSINNLAGGFDTGITHLNVWLSSMFSGVLSYVFLGLFTYLGAKFAADKIGKHASMIAGILLILVGVNQVIG